MSRLLEIEIETGEPIELEGALGRWGHIRIGPRIVFSSLVYDVEPDGQRTAARAETNLMTTFAERLRRLLEDEA